MTEYLTRWERLYGKLEADVNASTQLHLLHQKALSRWSTATNDVEKAEHLQTMKEISEAQRALQSQHDQTNFALQRETIRLKYGMSDWIDATV